MDWRCIEGMCGGWRRRWGTESRDTAPMLSLSTQPILRLRIGKDIVGNWDIARRRRRLLDLDMLVLVDLCRLRMVLMNRRPSPFRLLLLLRARTRLPRAISLSIPVSMPIRHPATSVSHSRHCTSLHSFQPFPLYLPCLLSIHAFRPRADPTMPFFWYLTRVRNLKTGCMTPPGAIVACDGEAVVEGEATDAVDSIRRRFFRPREAR